MSYEYTMTRQVEFSDTDMAGIMHFSNFFKYMENTEHAFLRSLGFSVHQPVKDEIVTWPRVEATCSFKRPLLFEDEVEIQLLVREKKQKSIVYEFVFNKITGSEREEVARGTLTAVCARFDRHSGAMKAIPIPEHIDTKIDVAPEELISQKG